VDPTHSRSQPYAKQRRSQRILLCVPIMVSGQRSNGTSFSEQTKTQVVNAHGALILLREKVAVGQKLRIQNLGTSEELACTVTDIDSGSEAPQIGVGFAQPCAHFWRVSFPPVDWSPHNSEAKRVSALPVVTKTVVVRK
jgi:hypothetical protein